MSDKISRREFLKVAGLGTAASATLSSAAAPLTRPTENANFGPRPAPGGDILTTCSLCPAGCGLVVEMEASCLLGYYGNPTHPLNQGALCPRAGLSGFDRHPRVPGPLGGSPTTGDHRPVDWDTAVAMLAGAFSQYAPSEIAFVTGAYPDHLYDLLAQLAHGLGGAHLLRYSPHYEITGHVTLMDAAQATFGVSTLPYFDLHNAEVIFSFGGYFTETWLSPAGFSEALTAGGPNRPYLVHFEPRRSAAAAAADEWVSIRPGSEALIAQALSAFAPRGRGATANIDLAEVAHVSGIPHCQLEGLGRLFFGDRRALALPGGLALGGAHGLSAARAILELNVLADNLGRTGGLHLVAPPPLGIPADPRPGTFAQLRALQERVKMGEIKALFVHGLDLLAHTPLALDVEEALDRLDLLVSFSHAMDATVHRAHYHFPDHHPLESWGYQRAFVGSDRWAVTAIQPAQPAQGDSRATVDVLLAAVREIGGDLAQALPFDGERAFLQHAVASLHQRAGDAPVDPGSAWDRWLQKGGWWSPRPTLMPPVPSSSRRTMLEVDLPESEDGFDLQLLPYPFDGSESVNFGNGPETLPYVDIHPDTAGELGVVDGERVALTSPFGSIQALLRLVADIRRGVLALPLSSPDMDHKSAAQRNSVYRLLAPAENASGNLAYLATRVQLQKLSHS